LAKINNNLRTWNIEELQLPWEVKFICGSSEKLFLVIEK
jgi:hypothetical protein